MSEPEIPYGSHAERLLSIVQDHPASSGRIRLLVVDDDPSTVAALDASPLGPGVEVLSASTVEGARELLATAPVTLILCNPAVAGEGQRLFFERIAEHAAAAGAGIVALGGATAGLPEADLYSLGADAYLAKPVHPPTLAALVRSRTRRIAAQRRRMLQDPVTDRPNVSVFREAFVRAAYLAAREREPLSLLVLHLGALREIRLANGSAPADEALRKLAAVAADSLRKSDLLARGVGDSLLVLLPNTDAAGARRVVEKVYYRLLRTPLGEPAEGIEPSLSAGIAEAAPGADFEVALEAAVSALEPVWGAEERAYAAEPRTAPVRRPRVLLAEDDALTASIVRHRLERAGCEVIHVLDGSAVLGIAPGAGVSLLILDVKMPYVDGFEALRRLRSIRSMREVPVMLLTSMGDEDDIAHGFELGADDYLVKPFSPIELQARAQRLLRRST